MSKFCNKWLQYIELFLWIKRSKEVDTGFNVSKKVLNKILRFSARILRRYIRVKDLHTDVHCANVHGEKRLLI